jgi:hypothetical protein
MTGNDANHSRLAAFQPPIDWDDAVGEMLLSMSDDASARIPTNEEELDLDLFKRSLGSAPPVKFNSEGGLREPWVGGMDSNHDRGSGTTPWRDSSTREGSRIETDSEETVRRRRRVETLTAALALLAYAVAAFGWSITDWQRQIESPPPPQNRPSLDEQAQSAGKVLSPGVLLDSNNPTVEELAILKGLILIFPFCSFGGAVAAVLVRGRRDTRLHRRPRGRSLAGVTPQPLQRCLRGILNRRVRRDFRLNAAGNSRQVEV